jgi:hypothetical protein
MGNVLSDEKKNQVLVLGGLGWSLRLIEEKTGVRRETASAYLSAAGIAVRRRGGRPRQWPPVKRQQFLTPLRQQNRPPSSDPGACGSCGRGAPDWASKNRVQGACGRASRLGFGVTVHQLRQLPQAASRLGSRAWDLEAKPVTSGERECGGKGRRAEAVPGCMRSTREPDSRATASVS